MSEMTEPKKMSFLEVHRVELVAVGTTALIGAASAIDLNATIGPLVDSFVALIPSIMNLVLGLIPLMIVVAIAKFFPQLFNEILGWLKM
jgi:hypothetical protein